jgi:hypothetical protein
VASVEHIAPRTFKDWISTSTCALGYSMIGIVETDMSWHVAVAGSAVNQIISKPVVDLRSVRND